MAHREGGRRQAKYQSTPVQGACSRRARTPRGCCIRTCRAWSIAPVDVATLNSESPTSKHSQVTSSATCGNQALALRVQQRAPWPMRTHRLHDVMRSPLVRAVPEQKRKRNNCGCNRTTERKVVLWQLLRRERACDELSEERLHHGRQRARDVWSDGCVESTIHSEHTCTSCVQQRKCAAHRKKAHQLQPC